MVRLGIAATSGEYGDSRAIVVKPKPDPKRIAKTPGNRKRLAILGGIVAGVAVLAVGLAVWAFTGGKPPTSEPKPGTLTRSPLVVSRSGSDGAFKSVHEALLQAKA